MTEEEVSKLLSYENEMKKAGLGIGLSYVLRMIRVHYGENGRFQIESRIGHGTTMTMEIPLTGKVRRVGVHRRSYENGRRHTNIRNGGSNSTCYRRFSHLFRTRRIVQLLCKVSLRSSPSSGNEIERTAYLKAPGKNSAPISTKRRPSLAKIWPLKRLKRSNACSLV